MTKMKYILVGILLFVVTAGTSWALFTKNKIAHSVSLEPMPTPVLDDRAIPSAPPDLTIPDPTPATPFSLSTAKQVGVLLLGYGGAGHQGGFLTDVIILLNFDIANKKIAFIHIPRDLWVTVTAGSSSLQTKINATLPLGTKSGNYPTADVGKDAVLRGASLTKQAVTNVTGIPIQYVVGIDFNNFIGAIDALRGIEVNVPAVFDDPWYPVKGRELELCDHTPEEVTELSSKLSGFALEKEFPCRYEHLHFDPGMTHMNGETALKYSRSRHSTSDFARGERQIHVLVGVKDKLFSLKALDKVPEFFKTLGRAVKTDITQTTITDAAYFLKEIPNYKLLQFGLSTANVLQGGTSSSGASILMSKSGENDWSSVQNFIKSELAK